MTDFGQIKNYADYIKEDPFRRGLHFPAVEELLGDVSRRRILDVGCGDGLFPRLLAQRGASVVGYDKAPEKNRRGAGTRRCATAAGEISCCHAAHLLA
jgi:SAM-dependent methyltransferase